MRTYRGPTLRCQAWGHRFAGGHYCARCGVGLQYVFSILYNNTPTTRRELIASTLTPSALRTSMVWDELCEAWASLRATWRRVR